MSRTLALAVLVACAHSFVAAQAITPDGALKLNQIQVIGTHNSYRAGIASSEAKLMESHEPQSFEELDYLRIRWAAVRSRHLPTQSTRAGPATTRWHCPVTLLRAAIR